MCYNKGMDINNVFKYNVYNRKESFMTQVSSNLYLYDNTTGEIIKEWDDATRVITIAQEEAIANYKKRLKVGNFIFSIYQQCLPYLYSETITTADISRLIY